MPVVERAKTVVAPAATAVPTAPTVLAAPAVPAPPPVPAPPALRVAERPERPVSKPLADVTEVLRPLDPPAVGPRPRSSTRGITMAAAAIVIFGAGVTWGARHTSRLGAGGLSHAQVAPIVTPQGATPTPPSPPSASNAELGASPRSNVERLTEPTNAGTARAPAGAAERRSTGVPRTSQHTVATRDEATASAAAVPSASAEQRRACIARCNREPNCMVDCASDGDDETPDPASAPTQRAGNAPLPAAPSPDDVRAALARLESEVAACSTGPTAWAVVDVTFANSGRVTTANVRLPFAGTPAGSCVARLVHNARVPPFARPTIQVAYTYRVH